jgi:hypothetical protein
MSGIRNAIDTTSAAQAAISTEAQLEDVNTPLCNPFDDSRGRVADRGGSAMSRKPLDVWSTQMESLRAETPDTVQLDVQHNSGNVGIAA